MPVPDRGGGGGGGGSAGGTCPHPHEEAAVSVLKMFSRIYMNGNGLVVFGVFWDGLGYFDCCRFPKKKKFSALYVR